MFDYQLFLGFRLEKEFQSELDLVPEPLKALFIQNHPDYIQKIDYEGLPYLGKHLGSPVEFNQIDLVKENVISLLRKMVPNYPYENIPLVLFPVSKSL